MRKTTRLYQWDVLRANKSTQGALFFFMSPPFGSVLTQTSFPHTPVHRAAWGLEARVPFLDRAFLEVAMSIDPAEKMINLKEKADGVHPKLEKYLLRKAFDDPENPYLPAEVLWRQKEQFSECVCFCEAHELSPFTLHRPSPCLLSRRSAAALATTGWTA